MSEEKNEFAAFIDALAAVDAIIDGADECARTTLCDTAVAHFMHLRTPSELENARDADKAVDAYVEKLDVADYDISEVTEWLEQYYEAAGFEDYHNRVLAGMDDAARLHYLVSTYYDRDSADGGDGLREALADCRKK